MLVDLSPSSQPLALPQTSIATREHLLVSKAKERGYVTFEEVQALYPDSDEYLDTIDALLLQLVELGVAPVSAASVRPIVEAITADQRREAASLAKTRTRDLLDPVDQYMEEIRRFPILTRDQEGWLGIESEGVKHILENPELSSNIAAHSAEAFFAQLLEQIATERRQISRHMRNSGYSTCEVKDELGRLLQEILSRRLENKSGKSSALSQSLQLCPKRIHDNLFSLCGYLYALPIAAAQYLQGYISSRTNFPPRAKIMYYCVDGNSQLDQVVSDVLQRSERAKETMILHNLRLVASVAWRYRDRGVPILDLYQEGNLGLMKAVERFDYRQGNKFSTYAVWWIRQSITRAVADQGRTIRLPVHMHDRLHKIHRAEDVLRWELGREPNASELAIQCDLSPRKVEQALRREPDVCSLDSLLCCTEFPLDRIVPEDIFVQTTPCPTRVYAERWCVDTGGDSDDNFELPPCMRGEETLEQLAMQEGVDYSMLMWSVSASHLSDSARMKLWLPRELDLILNKLSQRQRSIVEKRFGLANGRVYTLAEIGKVWGLTRERIRQIQVKAMKLLRREARLRGDLWF